MGAAKPREEIYGVPEGSNTNKKNANKKKKTQKNTKRK